VSIMALLWQVEVVVDGYQFPGSQRVRGSSPLSSTA
jgi:hypothetical protein